MATLVWTFRETSAARVAGLLGQMGAAGLLILLPQCAALLAESIGWRLAFVAMGSKLPLVGLFRARLATEALAQTLPLGVVFCESLKPVLLARNCKADLATSLSGMAARKWLLVASQSAYVGVFGLLAFPLLARISPALLGGEGLPQAVLGVAALLFLLALLSCSLLSRGRVAARCYELAARLPWLGRKLETQRAKFEQTDGRLARFFASPRSALLPLPAFLGGWLLETVETALILHLLGVQLSFFTVGAVEVSSGFVRNLAFMVPAGLGVQDLSYLAFLRALEVPDALNVAAAFLLLKRAKECFWAVIGYAVLATDLRPEAALHRPLSEGVSC